MKKLSLLCIGVCFLSGCLSISNPIYGKFQTSPGVRIYQTDKLTIINITYDNKTPPDYTQISKLLKEIYK